MTNGVELSLAQVLIAMITLMSVAVLATLFFVKKWMKDMEDRHDENHERANQLQIALNQIRLDYVLKSDWKEFRLEINQKLDDISNYLMGKRP